METLKLSLNRNSTPVELGEGDNLRKLELREMFASERDKYLGDLAKRVRIGADGKPAGVKDFDGMQSSLITRCLFDGEKAVPPAEIQAWPASVVAQLFDACQKVNKLNQTDATEAEAEAKKG